jgi:hypothetical protein
MMSDLISLVKLRFSYGDHRSVINDPSLDIPPARSRSSAPTARQDDAAAHHAGPVVAARGTQIDGRADIVRAATSAS